MKEIIKMRKLLKITQDEMAYRLNMSRTAYIYLEQGKRDIKMKEVYIISEIFNVNVWYLIGVLVGELNN